MDPTSPPTSSQILAARIGLAIYWPVLALATHWPRLDLKLPDFDGKTDKIMHFGAFALLTLLLVNARLTGRAVKPRANLLWACVIAIVYATVDEVTQGYFQRTVSLADWWWNMLAITAVAVAQGLTISAWRGRTVTMWFCRAALALAVPFGLVMALTRGNSLAGLVVPLLPSFGFSVTADKLAHFFAAMILTWLLYGAAPLGAKRRLLNATLALGLSASISPAIEYAQTFVHRNFEVDDMVAHYLGMALAVAVGLAMVVIRWAAYPQRQTSVMSQWALDPAELQAAAELEMPLLAMNAASVGQTAASPRSAGQSVPKHSFVRGAMVVSSLTLVSRITGLARDAYLMTSLGLGAIADALWFGFAMPNLSRRLFGEGAMTAAFIPVYTDLLAQDRVLAKRFASLCSALTLIVLGLLTLAGELFLWTLLQHGNWSGDSTLAIRLTMIMLPYMPLVCVVALFGAVLQVHGKFAASAGMPIMLNVVMLAGTWWAVAGLTDDTALRQGVMLVGVSVVVAGVIQVVTQLVAMLKYEGITLVFAGVGTAFGTFWRNFVPSFLALAVFQGNTFIDQMIAMGLSPKGDTVTAKGIHVVEKLSLFGRMVPYPIEQGGLAALNGGQRLYQFPLGVFGLAIATAIFPALAHAASKPGQAGMAGFRDLLRQGLRLTVFIGLPASVGLVLIGLPLSRVIFEHGAFTTQDSHRVTAILIGYAPAIWAYSMTHVLTRGFYAMKDTRTPMVLSILTVLLNVTLNLILIWPLGAAGLAWSTAICAIVQCGLMLWIMRGYIEAPVDRSVMISWLRTASLSLLMAAALAPALWFYPPGELSKRGTLLELIIMLAVGLAVYLGGAWLLGSQEIAWVLKRRRKAG